jgi:ferric-dicitrate binding protein FerR (iron transport regulator)
MKSNIDKKLYNLCVKAVTGNINEDEKRFLEKWISESSQNKIEFEKIKSIWTKTALEDFPVLPDPSDSWPGLDERINNISSEKKISASVPVPVRSGGIFRLRPVLSAALVILFFLSIVFLWKLEMGGPNLKSVITGNKERKQISLSDGSGILLNSGSRIQYPQEFDEQQRKITLHGEAFFSVAKDDRPFIIITGNAEIKVLGTKFNVRSRNGRTRVFVKDGRVNLAQNSGSRGVVLSKGQLSSVNRDEAPAAPAAADPDLQLGWMEGKIVFNQTPLYEIADELERFYDVKLFLQEKSLESYSLTGSFKNGSIDSVLEMICLALDLDYIRQPSAGADGKEQFLIKHKSAVKSFKE